MKIKKNYIILALDTSCDETSAAVSCNDRILSNIIASQEIHQQWGGVVPFLAQQEHKKNIGPVIEQALKKASQVFGRKLSIAKINALAVTIGPGLAPALETGIKKVKKMAEKYHKPLIAVNHMEGHLLSAFAKNSRGNGPFKQTKPQFPILGLLVSGGHTQLVLMKDFGKYKLIGETLDDAAGEAFDKVAKMLNLGYPGGPIVSQLALQGKPVYDLPIPMKHSASLNFSFSGLKTACLYKIKKQKTAGQNLSRQFICNFCASFEKAVIESLLVKLKKAVKIYRPKQIVLGGGVVSNLNLRKAVRKIGKENKLPVFIPYSKKLFTDNAGMIGICAWHQAKRGDFVKDINNLDRQPNLNFSNLNSF